jgi:hypothetical protein
MHAGRRQRLANQHLTGVQVIACDGPWGVGSSVVMVLGVRVNGGYD